MCFNTFFYTSYPRFFFIGIRVVYLFSFLVCVFFNLFVFVLYLEPNVVGVSGLFMLDYLHPFSVTSGNMVFDLAASSGKDNEFEYNLLTVCRYWNLVKNPRMI